MSKASQRRHAAQRKRETEVRGSPDKRARMLLEQAQRWDFPVRWWRDCIKHLPPDEVSATTDGLDKALDNARRLVEIAASGWTRAYGMSEHPDSIMPGILLMVPDVHRPALGVKPLSVFGRAVSEETDPVHVLIADLPDGFEAGIWVFGSMVTGPGETFLLAAHRDGTRVASVFVQGQWLRKIPTMIARYAAYVTAAFQVEELATEATALIDVLQQPVEAWSDLETRTRLIREVTSEAQSPYLDAWWRLAINQFSGEASEEIHNGFEDYLERMMPQPSQPKAEPTIGELRQQLAASKQREQALLNELRLAADRKPALPAPEPVSAPILTAAQRLSHIF